MTKPSLTADQCRAFEILASDRHGVTEDFLVLAHRFDRDMIAGLVHEGLVAAQRKTVKAGARTIEVVRVRITDAGRKAIEG